MVRGEFELLLEDEDELILPNQFTIYGMQSVLRAAFHGIHPTWYMGLCARNPGDAVTLDSLNEPTVGNNGYERQLLPLNITNWGGIGLVNNESYVQSRLCTFDIAGELDAEVNRLFLTDGAYVIAISSAMPAGLQTLSTPLSTRYRLYFR